MSPSHALYDTVGGFMATLRERPDLLPDVRRYTVVDTAEALWRVVQTWLERGETLIYADTETTSTNPRRDKLVAVQLMADTRRRPVIIDWRRALDRGEAATWAALLAGLFADTTVVFHNSKFDLQFLMSNRMPVPRVWDTMLAEQVIHGLGMSDGRNRGVEFNLRATAARYLDGLDMSKAEREWFYEPAPLDERPEEWAAPFPDEECRYMALDVAVLPGIYEAQLERLKETGRTLEAAEIEMRAVPAFARMELRGLNLDVAGWRAFIAEKQENANRLENEVLKTFGGAIQAARIAAWDADMAEWRAYRDELKEVEDVARAYHAGDMAATINASRTGIPFLLASNIAPCEGEGEGWGAYKARILGAFKATREGGAPAKPKLNRDTPNIGSGAQLLAAFDVMGIEVPLTRDKKTGEYKRSTNKATLEALALDFPQVGVINEWRHEQKFVDSFGENLLSQIDEADGRLHSDYQQIGASTGRVSCKNPNSQQLPSKGEDGKRLRSLVRAKPGWKLLTADFSNIELRILAELSQDAGLLAAFASGKDVHSETARLMFGLEPDVDVKHTEFKPNLTYRNVAKTINFGLVYGMGPKKLAASLGVTVNEAKELMQRYFEAYAGAKAWLDATRAAGRDNLFSETMAGRRRYYTLPREPVKLADETWQEFKARRSDYTGLVASIERQSGNTPVQGTSADITKLALALLHEAIMRQPAAIRRGLYILITVHDEIVLEAHNKLVPLAAGMLKDAMYAACKAYLTHVRIDPPEVSIEDFWAKD